MATRRSVVWLDLEKKGRRGVRHSRSTAPPTPSSGGVQENRRKAPDYDRQTLHSVRSADYTQDTSSVYTSLTALEFSAGYEKAASKAHIPASVIFSDTDSADSDETEYPSPLRLALITLSLCLTLFLVALDRTVVSTAM